MTGTSADNQSRLVSIREVPGSDLKRRSRQALYSAVVALTLVALLLGGVLASPAQAVSYSAEEVTFVQLINDYRATRGLQPLLVSDTISEACDRHNSDMGKHHFFDHYTVKSDWFNAGASPWDRMAASGYNYNTYKGENIAAGYGTAGTVFSGWKNSSGHNANMLNTDYKVVGVSMVYVTGSPYGYYWTTDFGGYVDSTAHALGTQSVTTTTAAPTTTTPAAPTTTTARVTTTTAAPTTTTTKAQPTTTTTAGKAPATTFSDVNEATLYGEEILLLADLGIISGYGNGTFGPTAEVTRQQFAKMIVLALGYEVSPLTACAFRDVASLPNVADPLYPAGYIAACAAAGITVGKTADLFYPYEKITRAQLITMVARAAGLAEPPVGYRPPFDNFNESHYRWARQAAYAGLLNGLAGYGIGYEFWSTATRGEVCLLLANLVGE